MKELLKTITRPQMFEYVLWLEKTQNRANNKTLDYWISLNRKTDFNSDQRNVIFKKNS